MWGRDTGDKVMKSKKIYSVEWYVKPQNLENVLHEKVDEGWEVERIDTYHQNNNDGCFLYYCVVFYKEINL